MWRKISTIIVSTAIAVGIIAFMLFRIWDDLIVALGHAVWYYLLLASIVCLGAWWVRGIRYRSILSSLGVLVGVNFSTGCIFVSQTANLIVPARLGDLVRIFILGHEKHAPVSKGISSLVVERVFDIVTVALLGAISLLFVLDVPDWFYTLILLPLAAGAVFFAVLLFAGKYTSENRIIRTLLTIMEQIKEASLSVRAVIFLSGSSILIWLMDVMVCIFVVMMFQEVIPFAVVVLAIVVGNLVKAVPLTPGGVGTYELALALTFTLAGVPAAEAAMIAVVDHLVKNLITLGGGIASIYYFGGWVLESIKSAFEKRFGGIKPGGV
ncbi:MAG TPA: lysylphosphatidylglycerol synthase transmembrane domain-containing protein [Methanolinea sp.]|nr:lysylphosphatidylglycerol synthase transmembrane domain-containing protein [Methanolinea sp.]HQK55857.1 lysylphosphatidylglycerol synthase transmembrane domain-containing protein [Methanolinea sp.]